MQSADQGRQPADQHVSGRGAGARVEDTGRGVEAAPDQGLQSAAAIVGTVIGDADVSLRDRRFLTVPVGPRLPEGTSMPASSSHQEIQGTTVRHRKRGTTYKIIAKATLQTTMPIADEAAVVIYQGEDGRLWARPVDEFFDGRFEAIASPGL